MTLFQYKARVAGARTSPSSSRVTKTSEFGLARLTAFPATGFGAKCDHTVHRSPQPAGRRVHPPPIGTGSRRGLGACDVIGLSLPISTLHILIHSEAVTFQASWSIW